MGLVWWLPFLFEDIVFDRVLGYRSVARMLGNHAPHLDRMRTAITQGAYQQAAYRAWPYENYPLALIVFLIAAAAFLMSRMRYRGEPVQGLWHW